MAFKRREVANTPCDSGNVKHVWGFDWTHRYDTTFVENLPPEVNSPRGLNTMLSGIPGREIEHARSAVEFIIDLDQNVVAARLPDDKLGRAELAGSEPQWNVAWLRSSVLDDCP